jgi:hypothetical protein
MEGKMQNQKKVELVLVPSEPKTSLLGRLMMDRTQPGDWAKLELALVYAAQAGMDLS